MGLWLDVPTIGCAKKKLFGDYLDPGPTVGEWSPLQDEEHVIGVVLRTKSRVKPVFVSQGHRISLERASRIVLSTTAGYRIPEPVRQAHLAVNRHRQSHRDSIGRR
jgi:deoxyribonuclease V